MIGYSLLSLYRWCVFGVRLIAALPDAGVWKLPYRLVLFAVLWPLGAVLLVYHLLGFALDELLFRGYRKVSVVRPVFILGIPRSGTTWLQRVLAEDRQLTGLQLWECLFAPSITQRYLARALGWLLKGPAALLRRLPWRPLARMESIHSLGLTEPEEDFLLLWPLQACFLGMLLCPRSPHYWRLARFDEAVPAPEQRRVMRYYRALVQKHLYFHSADKHGADKTFLSKNPSFTPLMGALKNHFPDACLIGCAREPVPVVASQLSALRPAAQLLATPFELMQGGLLEMLHNYYAKLNQWHRRDAVVLVDMSELRRDLAKCVRELYGRFGMNVSPEFARRLQALAERGRRYQSGHRYSLEQFNLEPGAIERRFADVWPLDRLE